MSFIENILPYKVEEPAGFVPVLVSGQQIGLTKPDFAKLISGFDSTWILSSNGLELSPELKTFDERTKAVDDTFVAMSAAGHLPVMPDYNAFGGVDWISVCPRNSDQALFIIKRFYYACLGIQIQAVMLNGFTGDNFWIAIRSQHVEIGPGKQDIIVAGTLRHGETQQEALIHEAADEASLNEQDLRGVKYTGSIILNSINRLGFYNTECFHVYDLDLKDTVPKVGLPHEVDEIRMITNKQLFIDAENGVFTKPINLIVTDFLIRHGLLTSDYPEFDAIKELLYRR